MIELRNRSYGEYNKHFGSREIFFDVYKNGVETVYIVVYDAGELLHLQDIWPTGAESDNILGVVGVRQLIRELKKIFLIAILKKLQLKKLRRVFLVQIIT